MARQIHGNVRASDDGRKYFVSGNQDLCMKVRGHGNKIITNGTDCVELGLVMIDRLGFSGALDALEAADNLHQAHAEQHDIRREPPMRSEGEGGVTLPVGDQKGGVVKSTPVLTGATAADLTPVTSGETTTPKSKPITEDSSKAEDESPDPFANPI